MQISKERLCELIPHFGNMCLLNEVSSWDDNTITCLSKSHLDPKNPLRDDDGLACINAIEYAAQAIAIHAALNQQNDVESATSSKGYLVQVKNVTFKNIDLSLLNDNLTITATQIFMTPTSLVYNFLIADQGRSNVETLMTGRIMIFISEPS